MHIPEKTGIYFGRERVTEELYQKVFESKLILLYGVSGTGMTFFTFRLILTGFSLTGKQKIWIIMQYYSRTFLQL